MEPTTVRRALESLLDAAIREAFCAGARPAAAAPLLSAAAEEDRQATGEANADAAIARLVDLYAPWLLTTAVAGAGIAAARALDELGDRVAPPLGVGERRTLAIEAAAAALGGAVGVEDGDDDDAGQPTAAGPSSDIAVVVVRPDGGAPEIQLRLVTSDGTTTRLVISPAAARGIADQLHSAAGLVTSGGCRHREGRA
jgi:hypothetical protein